jgi:hypothetical protein
MEDAGEFNALMRAKQPAQASVVRRKPRQSSTVATAVRSLRGRSREVVEADLRVFYEHQRDRHSATMALDTYGHVFDELDGAERISAEQAIRKADAESRATLVRPAPNRVSRKKRNPAGCGAFVRAL